MVDGSGTGSPRCPTRRTGTTSGSHQVRRALKQEKPPHQEPQSRRQGPPGTTKTSNTPISALLENFKTTVSHGARTNM